MSVTAAHGVPSTPLYSDPMIRAFPRCFIYPILRGWPTLTTEEPEDVIEFPWQRVDGRHKEKYRALLYNRENNVAELL